MESIINTRLLSHPMNWVTVTVMVILAGIGLEIIFKQFSK